MTDNLRTWLEERETIHGTAPGKTWSNYGTPSFEVYDSTEYDDGDMGETLADSFSLPVAEAIVDAHNTLPKLLAGVRAVLELHRPMPVYEVAEMCENEDEDHQDSRHWEAEDGTLLCEDLPTGDTNCRWCCDEYGDPIEWPCFTVKKLREAINDE